MYGSELMLTNDSSDRERFDVRKRESDPRWSRASRSARPEVESTSSGVCDQSSVAGYAAEEPGRWSR